MSLPLIPPMLAVAGELPAVAEQAKWSFEMKWDGVRAVAYVDDGTLALYARSGREITAAYPELAGLALDVGSRRCILDGEIVALDASGAPSFAALQPRIQAREVTHAAALASDQPVEYFAFDLLQLDDTSLLTLPYEVRRSTLDALEIDGVHWQAPPVFAGSGDAALAASAQRGLEGIVAKRLRSRYEPGRRSDSWRKVKLIRTQEVVIGGWRTGTGYRASSLGSLLCGVPNESGQLRYAGRVGTGFTMPMLAELVELLGPLATAGCPFAGGVPALDARDAHWVEPRLVGEVGFSLWTKDGRLWHPRWRGLRRDKSPADVVVES